MVKIHFKNVGQGDSIILEWTDNKEANKIAVIDCNLYNDSNPVLDHITNNNYDEIEFLILTHPHLDHFSGFEELLNYCRANKILIKRFLHTSLVTPDYLKSASRSIDADKKLYKLFSLLKEMRDNGEIDVYAIDDNPDIKIPLGNEFKMEFLAPSAIEIDKFIKGESYPFDEEHSTAKPNANWLSTIIKIYNNDRTILLTSDAESSVLSRIGQKKRGRLGENKIIIAQVPHHGSSKNLNKIFWRMRKRNYITPTIISVGKNSYGHPSKDLLEFFNSLGNYRVERTDDLGLVMNTSSNRERAVSLLNIISRSILPLSNPNISGDKSYVLTGSSFKRL